MKIFLIILIVFSGAAFLASAWIDAHASADARRYLPPQFSDALSSRYYMQYVLFDRTVPLHIRRRIAMSSGLAFMAFVGFAAVAYLAGNPVIAALLLLICAVGATNLVWQWRRARR